MATPLRYPLPPPLTTRGGCSWLLYTPPSPLSSPLRLHHIHGMGLSDPALSFLSYQLQMGRATQEGVYGGKNK